MFDLPDWCYRYRINENKKIVKRFFMSRLIRFSFAPSSTNVVLMFFFTGTYPLIYWLLFTMYVHSDRPLLVVKSSIQETTFPNKIIYVAGVHGGESLTHYFRVRNKTAFLSHIQAGVRDM